MPPPDLTVVDLVEAGLRADPEAVAVVCGSGSLTFAELDAAANRLAHHLQRLGVGREVIVGLCVERSLEMAVGLLGVLKAGGACLPMDPSYPAERLRFMAADARLGVVLTLGRLVERCPAGDAAVVCLDRDAGRWAGCPASAPPRDVGATDLAYVVYTSGSTGQPKGVLLTHAGLVNHHRAVIELYRLGPGDRVLQFCSIGFDASIEEIFPTWSAGATLVLRDDAVPILGRPWLEWLARQRVTVVDLPTAYWHAWARDLEQLGEDVPDVLRLVIVGGEKALGHVWRRWAGTAGRRCRWVNTYGPTEASIVATSYEPGSADEGGQDDPPLGRPLVNVAVRVVDEAGEEVADGVPGELHIGGVGVARGYLDRPQLTAERFVDDPRGDGARWYRTGDVVLRLASGDLAYLGRLDDQVKVGGFRVECGEVEAALASHPSVAEAVVTAHAVADGGTRLVAHVVPAAPSGGGGADRPGLAAMRVAEWEQLYDKAQLEPSTEEPTLDTAGWASSYTGDLIPPAEMEAWADDTVDRILRLHPERVLEIGCGTGLLLWRLAPRCRSFVGTDVSVPTLARLGERLHRSAFTNVRLVQAEAVDFAAVADDRFDTVVVNSVVEAFPDRHYLEQALAGAVASVGERGTVFVGDVRSLPLLGAFHASVELHRSRPGEPAAAVRRRYERRLLQELELVIHPAFFTTWAASVPMVSAVEVHLKRGRHDNELSRFRYDVTLHVGATDPIVVDRWLDWHDDDLDLDRVARLASEAGSGFGITRIPNARVARHVAALRLLTDDAGSSAADITAAATMASAGSVDPGDLWQLGETLGWTVHCSWASADADGRFDAVLLPEGDGGRPVDFPVRPVRVGEETNDPLAGRAARGPRPQLTRELRRHLAVRLPRHMVPSAIVPVVALPLTHHGKVDRAALPLPDLDQERDGATWIEPATPTEVTLAEIWAEVLDLDRVGADEDFFELGGDSLLGAQVIVRAREVFAVDVPLRSLFASVTVRQLASAIDRQREGGAASAPPLIVPVGRDGPLPLTFAQEGLWFLDQLVPDNPFYNVPGAYRLRGQLDVAALGWALDEVVARHEVLRTTFPSIDGRPDQRIHPPSGAQLEVVDLSHLEPPAAEVAARHRAGEEARRPFDLAQGPLLRAQVLRLEPDHHVLLVTMHHIVSDGWSTGVLMTELAALYRSGRGAPTLPPLAIQFADFAAWQRRALADGPHLRDLLAFWTEALADAPLVLELPADRPRPSIPSYRGASHRFEVGPDIGRAVVALSRRHATTPFTILLAAFSVLLARAADVDDVVVGTPLNGRDGAELEDLIGYFVNTIPLRVDLSGDPGFDDVVVGLRETTRRALAHQELPLERLVAELDPVRDASRSPIVQVLFQMVEPLQGSRTCLGDVEVSDLGGLTGASYGELDGGGTVAPFDLDLFVAPAPDGGFTGELVYATDLFDTATAARLADRFTTLLEAVTNAPERSLRQLTSAHADDLGGHEPPAPYGTTTVPDLVEAQVARNPDAVAVVAGDQHLTYAELDAGANRLAHHLQAAGAGPDVVVAVCLLRSTDMAVALLAVLKAGGACLPLDPTSPTARLAFQMRDASPAAVLTTAALAPRLPPLGTPVIRLDVDATRWSARPSSAPSRTVEPSHAAYVIYTSGSTGEPKGVLLTHGGLVNHHHAAIDLYGLAAGDKVLQFCSVGFDASIEELFPTWAAGATVVFRPDDAPLLGRDWLAWLRVERITVMNLPTGYWHAWVRDIDALDERVPEDLRLLIVGGEQASAGALAAWDRHGGGRARWVNAYGPTEATCMAMTWEASGHRRAEQDDPPIGRPLPNVVARVVDAFGGPAPAGGAGELLLGGACLARGYLNRPQLTADRFVTDPVTATRLYRTGDLVRQRPDGELAYVGRIDEQVKIRGFRVECGEVEAVLGRHPGVAEALVVARQDQAGGDRRLVAYVVPTDEAPAEGALRRHLADRLPAYMVPSAFVALGQLPLTANGKVDRDALPAPPPVPATIGARRAPRSPVEQRVAAIWGRVLGVEVEEIGVDDDFFALGGHSLLATQVVAQVREELRTTTPLRTIFEAPTVSTFAAAVEAERVDGPAMPPMSAAPREPGEPLPLSLAQEQMWRLETEASRPGLYNLTTLQRFDRPVDEDALRDALAFLVERHETLRTSITVADGRPLQVVHPRADVDLTVSDLSTVRPAERQAALQRFVATEDARPFDLARAPLFRARLVHLDDGASQLVTTFDHLICDGTAAYVFLGELAEVYDATMAGRPPDLPTLELQFADFALWQRRHVTEAVLQRQVDWWVQALQGMPLGPAVPFDHDPTAPSRRIATHRLLVDAGSRRLLQDLATATGSTVFVVAAAAVQAVLGIHGGRSDVVVSTTLSGRGRAQLEGVVGMFSGIGRIRTDLSGDPTFTQVVLRTRTHVLAMFDNQDVPFMQVRRRLMPDFPTGGAALFAALPIELQYFRTASDRRARGAAVVEGDGEGGHDHELFFRGQLHPMSITLLDDGAELRGEISYKLDFYEPATIERLADDLQSLLAQVGRDPELRLSSLRVTASRRPR